MICYMYKGLEYLRKELGGPGSYRVCGGSPVTFVLERIQDHVKESCG